MLEPERERVAATARRVVAEGLVLGTPGNVSARTGDLVALTPTGAALERLQAQEIAVVDLAGHQLEGELEVTSELELHLAVYRSCDAGAVVHTHPPIATALSCVVVELPVVHYQMLELGGPVRVAPYATFGTPELAAVTLEALEQRSAALMANHGAITHGLDLEVAVERALLLEWACAIYWRAATIGAPRALSEQQQLAFSEAVARRGYGSTHRIAR
jgi:L-fuculose-phosphate aldolase